MSSTCKQKQIDTAQNTTQGEREPHTIIKHLLDKAQSGLGPCPGWGQVRVGALSGLGPIWTLMGPYMGPDGPLWAHIWALMGPLGQVLEDYENFP